MEHIHKWNVVHQLEKRQLLSAINCVAGLAIFFFGYDQGMMGGVNNAENYYDTTMHFGHKDPQTGAVVVTNTVLQGGIVSKTAAEEQGRILILDRSLRTTSVPWLAA